MAKLAMTREFLAGFHKLDKPVQKAVSAAFEKFASHTYAGLHLEKIENSRDPHIRTIRITDFWRGVVLAPTAGDEYCLVTVLPHDDAIDYAKSRAVSVNSVLGVLEIRNAEALDAIEPALDAVAQTTQQRLFAEVKDSDLLRLGIEPEVLPLVRVITDEAVLGTLANLLPDIQYTALTGLASGMSVEEVWAEVAAGLTSGETVDPADVGAAIARSGDRIVMVESREELLDMLDRPFVAWRTFLHPAQRAFAYKTGYKGPTQVTGSAGTGKTVTALHRVAHLARSGCGQILLTTYTTTLAQNLADSLRLLVDDPAALARVETINLDKLAIRVVGDSLGQMPRIASASELAVAWTSVDASGFTPEFLIAEWERVILAQDINSLDGYLTTKRAGRGRLTGTQKVAVWNAIERYTTWLREAGLWTFLTVNAEAARLAAESAPRYRHIVVDESQDLHPSQWRLLRALAPAESDDLFLVGDGNQRIYGGQVSLRSLGINVVGRSKKLTICYRSTQEIVAWAAALLTGSPAETTNEADHSLDGYRSALHGRKPAIYAARDRDDEHANLAGQIEAWIADGVEPHAIAVAARTNWLAEQAATTLSMLGIETVQLGLAASVTNAVRVGTMHRLKGLEFRAVAVIGVEDGIVPHPRAITDPVAQAEEIQRERCLLFVACTRARDALYVSYAGTASGFLLGAVPSS